MKSYQLLKFFTGILVLCLFLSSGCFRKEIGDSIGQLGGIVTKNASDQKSELTISWNYIDRFKVWAFNSIYSLVLDSGNGFYSGSLPSSTRMVSGDFDGDGKGDMALIWNYSDRFEIWVFPWSGNGSYYLFFDSGNGFSGGPMPEAFKVTSGDYNGDGKDDVAVVWNYSDRFKVWAFTNSTYYQIFDSGNGFYSGPLPTEARVNTRKFKTTSSTGGGDTIPATGGIPPALNIISPTNGASVNGTVNLQVSSSDNFGVTKLEYYLGTTKVGESTVSPFSFSLNTENYADGTYALKAIAYNNAGDTYTDNDTSILICNSVLLQNITSISGNDNPLMGTLIKSMEVKSAGGSGLPYIIVVSIDTSKLGQYQASETDPYWLKYYLDFWQNGQHISAQRPQKPHNSATNWLVAPWDLYTANMGFNSISSYKIDPNYFTTPYSPEYRWYDAVFQIGSWNNNTFSPAYIHRHHYMGKIKGQYTFFPTYVSYYDSGDFNSSVAVYRSPGWLAQIYLNFRIYTGNTNTYEENPSTYQSAYYGTTYPEVIVAGEVAPSGWALIPLAATHGIGPGGVPYPYSPWVIVKPYDKEISFTNEAGKAYFKVEGYSGISPIKYNGVVPTNELQAFTAQMDNIILDLAMQPTKGIGTNLDLSTVSLGGMQIPDKDRNAQMFVVTGVKDSYGQLTTNIKSPSGSPTLTREEAATVYAAYRVAYVNGSNTNLQSAIKNAGDLSSTMNGNPVVLVYSATSILDYNSWTGYDFDLDTKLRTLFTDTNAKILAGYGGAGNGLLMVAHSRAAFNTLYAGYDKPYLQFMFVNPAHGDGVFVGGGRYDSYINMFEEASARIDIIKANRDTISSQGGGTCVGINPAMCSNLNYTTKIQFNISDPAVGHGFDETINTNIFQNRLSQNLQSVRSFW